MNEADRLAEIARALAARQKFANELRRDDPEVAEVAGWLDETINDVASLLNWLRAETERRERLERRIRERIEEEISDHGGLVFTALARVEAYEDVLGMLGALDTGEERV